MACLIVESFDYCCNCSIMAEIILTIFIQFYCPILLNKVMQTMWFNKFYVTVTACLFSPTLICQISNVYMLPSICVTQVRTFPTLFNTSRVTFRSAACRCRCLPVYSSYCHPSAQLFSRDVYKEKLNLAAGSFCLSYSLKLACSIEYTISKRTCLSMYTSWKLNVWDIP